MNNKKELLKYDEFEKELIKYLYNEFPGGIKEFEESLKNNFLFTKDGLMREMKNRLLAGCRNDLNERKEVLDLCKEYVGKWLSENDYVPKSRL